MENKNVWLIIAKSNLHVGNENNSSYGLIDKAIQRDALTNLPCINSSSLKGAFNEYATEKVKMEDTKRIHIFGVDKGKENATTQKGCYIFFDANILFLPVRDDCNLYKLVTCPAVLDLFLSKMKLHGIDINRESLKQSLATKGYNDYEEIENEIFKEYCSDEELPIIARNRLKNGESDNLWYEQLLPQETVFYTLIISDNNDLDDCLEKDLVQIGANATIGYGYCKLQKL